MIMPAWRSCWAMDWISTVESNLANTILVCTHSVLTENPGKAFSPKAR
ncbi:Uncharacterised protein [Vibrio cholerae]|nr:Uncharacterised protein [Vibrio cholerae]CSB30091.1 Uncharacterised protein [Vibrio cholerae]CSI24348.1 Uncharacterised protein [Vibrio cholerae]